MLSAYSPGGWFPGADNYVGRKNLNFSIPVVTLQAQNPNPCFNGRHSKVGRRSGQRKNYLPGIMLRRVNDLDQLLFLFTDEDADQRSIPGA